MEHVLGDFPWVRDARWPSETVVEFHRSVLARIRNVHAKFALSSVLLQDEAWTEVIQDSDEGILMDQHIAAALGENVICTRRDLASVGF